MKSKTDLLNIRLPNLLKFHLPKSMARIFLGAIVYNIVLSEILYGNEIMPFDAERFLDQLIDLVLSYPNRQD